MNISILHVVVLVLFGVGQRPRVVLQTATLLVVITFLGYVVKYAYVSPDPTIGLANYRLINRTFVALLLLAISVVLRLINANVFDLDDSEEMRAEIRQRDDFEGLLAWLQPLSLVVFSLLLLTTVAVTDFLTPAQFNLPILYMPVLLVAATMNSRSVLWGTLILLWALTFAGYYMGPPVRGNVGVQWWHSLMTNRLIVAFAMLVAAFLMQRWAVRPKRQGVYDPHLSSHFTRTP